MCSSKAEISAFEKNFAGCVQGAAVRRACRGCLWWQNPSVHSCSNCTGISTVEILSHHHKPDGWRQSQCQVMAEESGVSKCHLNLPSQRVCTRGKEEHITK